MTEIQGPLSVEQAKSIELPSWIHPIERVRTVGELATQTSQLRIVGWSLKNQLAYTRGGLVKHAEIRERAEDQLSAVHKARERINNDK